jgi:hypothetical protein
MDEWSVEVGGQTTIMLPTSEVVLLEALEFTTQSVTARGVKAMVLKMLANDYWSHVSVQDNQVEAMTCF